MQLFKVYSLTDERVKEVVRKELNQNLSDAFLYLYSHYCIEHNFFCNENDELWCDNYIICDYDEKYLK